MSHPFIEYCILGWENLPRTLLLYFTNVILAHEGYFHFVACKAPDFQNTTVNSDLRYMVVPVDGEIHQGESTITIEHLTGESKPLEIKVGDRVPGGARNLEGLLIVKRFAAFLAPLTSGRINIAAKAVYISKLGLAIAVRYAVTSRAFSVTPNGREVLLLDYPSHLQGSPGRV